MASNTGAMLRLAACFGFAVDVIEPCGFVFDDKRLRRVGMDYLDRVELRRHSSWTAYQAWRRESAGPDGRLILLSTGAALPYAEAAFGEAIARHAGECDRILVVDEGRLTEAVVRTADLPRVQAWAFLNSLRGWCPATRG